MWTLDVLIVLIFLSYYSIWHNFKMKYFQRKCSKITWCADMVWPWTLFYSIGTCVCVCFHMYVSVSRDWADGKLSFLARIRASKFLVSFSISYSFKTHTHTDTLRSAEPSSRFGLPRWNFISRKRSKEVLYTYRIYAPVNVHYIYLMLLQHTQTYRVVCAKFKTVYIM